VGAAAAWFDADARGDDLAAHLVQVGGVGEPVGRESDLVSGITGSV
jgi:hypothetical protein